MKKFTSAQFNQLLEYLYDLQRLGIKVGLDHTRRLLHACGNPQDSFKSFHIAGTNGKGSASAMIASILREDGYKVGLYTSPHLLRFNERVRVNGVPISDSKIVEFVSQYKPAIEKIKSTFFEATTALAFNCFKEQKVDVAVVETGLGGRLDSTNVLNPNVTVITSITADHTEILGKDLKKIAFEKGGIIKDGIPLVLSAQNEEVIEILLEIAENKNADIRYCIDDELDIIELDENGTAFLWNNRKYRSNLIGEHQAKNAILAIEAVKIFNSKIEYEAIKKGLKKVNWPGRLQKLSNEKPIYYDVAHNPHGINVILDTLSKIYKEKPIGVIALKADKELVKIAPQLKEKFSELIVTSTPDADLINAKELHKVLSKLGVKSDVETNCIKAFDLVEKNINNSTPGLIFGSHYIGKAVYEKFGFSFDNGIIRCNLSKPISRTHRRILFIEFLLKY